jgi:DNA-binding transcriptional LysR family regulator
MSHRSQLTSHLVNRLRFRQLALLSALGQTRNLHRAAEMLHLAQPSATKMLQDLERNFGFSLFDRMSRGIQPTEMGLEVIDFATRLLADLDRFSEHLDSRREGGPGQLVLGAVVAAMPEIVAHAIAELNLREPRLAIRILGESNEDIIAMLLQRKIDIALGRFSATLLSRDVDFEQLGHEKLLVVVRKGHPLARETTIELRDLMDLTWILQPSLSMARQIVNREFDHGGVAAPCHIIECGSILATLQMLQKIDGVTTLPESIVRTYLDTDVLVTLPIDFAPRLPPFGLLTRRGGTLTPAAREFIRLVRSRSNLSVSQAL